MPQPTTPGSDVGSGLPSRMPHKPERDHRARPEPDVPDEPGGRAGESGNAPGSVLLLVEPIDPGGAIVDASCDVALVGLSGGVLSLRPASGSSIDGGGGGVGGGGGGRAHCASRKRCTSSLRLQAAKICPDHIRAQM